MIGRDGLEEADRYGAIGWIAGVVLSAVIAIVMFAMAEGFY